MIYPPKILEIPFSIMQYNYTALQPDAKIRIRFNQKHLSKIIFTPYLLQGYSVVSL